MSDINKPDFWQEKYRQKQFPWDLGGPSPVFVRLAENGRFPPGKMIVLGAGRGHDARLFALHGFEVTAVDFAAEAVAAMRDAATAADPLTVLQTDFFALPPTLNGTFDYVLEYTCYCAIYPQRRDEFVRLVKRLLRVGGRYISLAFPIGQRAGGPPFVVQPDAIIGRFGAHAFTLLHRESPPDSVFERRGVEELLILEKR